MKVVADSSPLILLAKLGLFEQIRKSYGRIFITEQVGAEVAAAGAGLPGASEVAEADWIDVRKLRRPASLAEFSAKFRLGAGELSSIVLAEEIGADVVLADDTKARQLILASGFAVRGTIGLLESFHRRGDVADLREVFRRLLGIGAYVSPALLNQRLDALGLTRL